jgi:hypothetical protein
MTIARRELTDQQKQLICAIINDSAVVHGLVGREKAVSAAAADTGWSEDEIRALCPLVTQ